MASATIWIDNIDSNNFKVNVKNLQGTASNFSWKIGDF